MSTLSDWLGTFLNILIKPTPETFRAEAQKAPGKSYSAYFWLALVLPIAQAYGYIFYGITIYNPVGYIIISLLFPIGFFFYPFLVNFFHKKIFKRKADHHIELIYLMVSIFFVLYNLNILATFVPPPFGIYLGFASYVYYFVLNILALKALTHLKFWQSLVTVFISTIFAVPGFFCIPIFIINFVRTVPALLGGP